jgi:DNA-binding CsgD family transcriptional regulator
MDIGGPRAHAQTGGGDMSEMVKSEAVNDVPTADAYLSRWIGPAQHQRWSLAADAGPMTLGRSDDADVRIIGDPLVSRVHARLERVGNQWTLVDDGLSANGTYVNGRRVSGRVRLHDRDVIRAGSTMLSFCAPDQTVTEQTVAGSALPAVKHLTQPQTRVLQALARPFSKAQGYPVPASNQQIAQDLFLSLDAVKTHLRVLYHKFGIEDLPQNQKRARLAELALQMGLVPDE